MYLIEMILATLATTYTVPYATIIMLALIPFIVVAIVVVAVFFMRRRQKRRMRGL